MSSFATEQLLARSEGLLDPSVTRTRLAVVGVGSVGSYLAEVFARCGVGGLVLVDPEVVDSANVCRAIFTANDVGKRKVEATESRVRRINPSLVVTSLPSAIEDLDDVGVDTLCRDVDLVVAAVDSNRAAAIIARFAYAAGKPSVHVGIWNGGGGGEVVISAPPGPCYICATAVRHRVDDVAPGTLPAVNYGLGRMDSVNALVADIHHVASAGAKLALGLLSPAQTPARRLVEAALADSAVYLALGNDLDYWAFPRLLDGVPGQYAFQSLWATVERNPDCAVCGSADVPTAPSVSTASPSARSVTADELRAMR